MRATLAAVAFSLFASGVDAAPARQSSQAPAAATIGIVTTVVGEWYIEGPRTRLTAGEELPPDSRLNVEPFTGGGPDLRAIDLSMYDGSVRSFKCSVAATCDGAIRLSIPASSLLDDVRRVLRALHGPQRFRPMLVGNARPGGVLELKNGAIDINAVPGTWGRERPGATAGIIRGSAQPAIRLTVCALSPEKPLVETLGSSAAKTCENAAFARGTQPGGGTTRAMTLKKAGLYEVRAATGSDPSAPHDSSIFLAVESSEYGFAADRYSRLLKLPAFSTLTPTDRTRAGLLLLEQTSESLNRRR